MKKDLGYEEIAAAYAASVDTKPIHVYYERPNLLSLLPENISGLEILDIGCGSGWYAEHLQKKSAKITALDASAKMVEITRKRLNNQGQFLVADLEQPWCFLVRIPLT